MTREDYDRFVSVLEEQEVPKPYMILGSESGNLFLKDPESFMNNVVITLLPDE